MFHYTEHDIVTLERLNYYHKYIAPRPTVHNVIVRLSEDLITDLSERYNVVLDTCSNTYSLEEK